MTDEPRTRRDLLATERTLLAIERTLLAYLRTAAAFMIGGVGLPKLWPHPLSWPIGATAIVIGIVVAVLGVNRAWRTRARISPPT